MHRLRIFPCEVGDLGGLSTGRFLQQRVAWVAELANGGVTTVHNWAHNNRSPQHLDAELKAHRGSLLRARYSLEHVDRLPPDVVNTFDDLEIACSRNGSEIRRVSTAWSIWASIFAA